MVNWIDSWQHPLPPEPEECSMENMKSHGKLLQILKSLLLHFSESWIYDCILESSSYVVWNYFPNTLTTWPCRIGPVFLKEQALGHVLFPAEHVQVYVTIFLKISSCSWWTAKHSPTNMGLPLVFTSLFLICCSILPTHYFFY